MIGMPVCEVAVKLFPAIRAELAQRLVGKYGLSQTTTAQLLKTSQPAISQYLQAKRGASHKLLANPAIETQLNKACEDLVMQRSNIVQELCGLCKILRQQRLLCEICSFDRSICTECARSC
jgi:predicted transcriptional regulator